MQKQIILLLLIFTVAFSFAQDQLFKKDNTKLEVKILEVNPTQIKYKLFSNPDGPLYVINKNEIALIIYKNGQHEAFKEEPKENDNTENNSNSYQERLAKQNEEELKKFKEFTKNNNVVFLNTFEVFNFALGGSYFRELLNNHIIAQVPFAFSFGEPYAYNTAYSSNNNTNYFWNYNYYQYNNIYNFNVIKKSYDIGLGLYINTAPNKVVTHFIGPMFRIAQYNATYKTNFFQEPDNIDPNQPYNYNNGQMLLIDRSCVFNETYFTLNNGFLFRISPQFNIMLNINLGRLGSRSYVANNPSQYSTNHSTYTNHNGRFIFQMGFNVGYRF